MLKCLVLSFFFSSALLITSCGNDDESTGQLAIRKSKAVLAYADLVYNNYLDALTSAKTMQSAIRTMTDNPNATTYDAAKNAWLAAREPYGQSEAFRLYGGPVDELILGTKMSTWPLNDFGLETYLSQQSSIELADIATLPSIQVGFAAIEYLSFAENSLMKLSENLLRRNLLSTLTHALLDNMQLILNKWQNDYKDPLC